MLGDFGGNRMKKIITYILGLVAISSIFLASGIKEVADWHNIAKPYFIVFYVCVAIALLINNWNYVRRFTYPTLVCISSWLYNHKIIRTAFTKNTYRLYKWQKKSYKNLFIYVQDLFDLMYS